MKRLLSLVVLVALISIPMVRAQTEEPDLFAPIPACDADEIAITSGIVNDMADRIGMVAEEMGAATLTTLPLVRTDLDQLQLDWWADYAPELPYCTLAIYAHQAFSRSVDEMLLAVMFLEMGEFEASTNHQEAMGPAMDMLRYISTAADEYGH
jgi:hypothetical protein